MAYPGVGILSGDSLQYLSIVTAHGVIMVFFMIIPLLFGAFGNFLLPSQLGVHDVAFPRLNSAAFWFLPAGLIMLCQLICIDKRYHKINCFNMAEAQSLLKKKFFPDLINGLSFKKNSNYTESNLKYSLYSDMFKNNSYKNMFNYSPATGLNYSSTQIVPKSSLYQYSSPEAVYLAIKPLSTSLSFYLGALNNNVSRIGGFPSYLRVLEALQVPTSNRFSFSLGNLIPTLKLDLSFLPSLPTLLVLLVGNGSSTVVSEDPVNLASLSPINSVASSTIKNNYSLRFYNHNYLKFKYDYKNGNYLTDDVTKQFNFLSLSKINISNNKRFNSWFFFDSFDQLLKSGPSPINSESFSFIRENKFFKNSFEGIFASHVRGISGGEINSKFSSLNTLNQKFNKLFLSSSIQQRIYGNWRSLKFSREA